MRQTFFHELEELEKKEIEKKKEDERIELFLRKQNRFKNIREWIPFFSALVFALLAGVVVIYALYLFINVSKIGNISDIHLTEILNLAIRTYKGEVYNNSELGIKNWMIFSDQKHGLEIRYPESWKYKKNDNHLFEIKKYNSQRSINESLAAAIFLDYYIEQKEKSIEDFIVEKTGTERIAIKKEERSGIEYFDIGKNEKKDGLLHRNVFWQKNGKIYSLEIIHYNKKNNLAEADFEKIISVMEVKK